MAGRIAPILYKVIIVQDVHSAPSEITPDRSDMWVILYIKIIETIAWIGEYNG